MATESTEGRVALTENEQIVLEAIEGQEVGVTFTALLEGSGLARTTFRRTLSTLVGQGFIEKAGDRYHLRPAVEGPSSRGPDRDAGDEEPEQRAEDLGIEAAQEEAAEANARLEEERALLDRIDEEIASARVAVEEARIAAEDEFARSGDPGSDSSGLDEAELRLKDLQRKRRWQERREVEAGIAADEAHERLIETQLRAAVAERERLETEALAARDAAIQTGNAAAALEGGRSRLREALRLKRDFLTGLKNPRTQAPAGFAVRRTSDGGFYRP